MDGFDQLEAIPENQRPVSRCARLLELAASQHAILNQYADGAHCGT